MKNFELTSNSDAALTLFECEERLRALGLTEQNIKDLATSLDVVGDMLLDNYFKEFYGK